MDAVMREKKVWLFNNADGFASNVKYFFLYVNKFRPDIFCSFITHKKEDVNYVRSLGYRACLFDSAEGRKLMREADVYVNEQCKEDYPQEIQHAKLLNLFHGVGLKAVEKKIQKDTLLPRIAKKYIRYSEFFENNMCFLVTSPFMEMHFKEQIAIDDCQIITGGYPRNYGDKYNLPKTFDSSFIQKFKRNSDTKILAYAPTYREFNSRSFLKTSLQDFSKLNQKLEENNAVLILKLHPRSYEDFYFNQLKNQSLKNIICWDNKNDFYEVFDQIDVAIVDYSSIYYDMLAAGVKQFIRYVYDLDDEQKHLKYDYLENTSGQVCKSFDDLLSAIDRIRDENFSNDNEHRNKIMEKFWSYASDDSMDRIIQQVEAFKIRDRKLPNFYSFDIFDTVFTRKVLQPKGIFFRVIEKIRKSDVVFPELFFSNYVDIRMQAEANVREFVKKNKGWFEISFDQIFDRLADVYNLNSTQISLLKEWEIEAELENVIPRIEQITYIEKLLKDGNTVVLISDMYLPKFVIQKMLQRASPILVALPLYLSSEYGGQKTSQKLYLKVWQDFYPWKFNTWHHYGDNEFADGKRARELGIHAHVHSIPKFNKFEQDLVDRLVSYDAYLVAGELARYRTKGNLDDRQYFAFALVNSLFVPYIAWCIKNAIAKGIRTLYFISRDGYLLQGISKNS